MVEAGFIDIETALWVLKQPLDLRDDGKKYADRLLYLLSFSKVKFFALLSNIIVFLGSGSNLKNPIFNQLLLPCIQNSQTLRLQVDIFLFFEIFYFMLHYYFCIFCKFFLSLKILFLGTWRVRRTEPRRRRLKYEGYMGLGKRKQDTGSMWTYGKMGD